MSESAGRPGVVCLIGSGETSPAFGPLYAELIDRAGGPAVLLDTTYGFQENADELSRKLQRFFQQRVRRPLAVASLRDVADSNPLALERAYGELRQARFVFAGPGSPSYAVRQWLRSQLPGILGDRLAEGACLAMASAAAITIGRVALPVYEIYKVGEPVHWIDGLDLLRPYGLDLAIIPHYDNAEGGSHDTRFCYVGERRFWSLEEQLPAGVSILGIAEHTVAIIGLARDTLEVRGRGFAALRRDGRERLLGAGTATPLDELRAKPGRPAVIARPPREPEVLAGPESVFAAAVERDDFQAAVAALLALEERPGYRAMLVRLGEAAQQVCVERDRLEQLIDVARRLRDEARRERRFSDADRLRDALLGLGIEIHDTPIGADRRL